MSAVDQVHADVLTVFTWQEDRLTHGLPERWERPQLVNGRLVEDCDGFAIECWHRLVDLGFRPRLAVCRTEVVDPASTGWDHCVCTIETGGRVLVLDNRYPTVVPIELLPYDKTAWARQRGSIAEPWEVFTVR